MVLLSLAFCLTKVWLPWQPSSAGIILMHPARYALPTRRSHAFVLRVLPSWSVTERLGKIPENKLYCLLNAHLLVYYRKRELLNCLMSELTLVKSFCDDLRGVCCACSNQLQLPFNGRACWTNWVHCRPLSVCEWVLLSSHHNVFVEWYQSLVCWPPGSATSYAWE